MSEDDLRDRLAVALRPLGLRQKPGESFLEPPLEVRAYHYRSVRLSWVPIVGKAISVVTVVQQPADLGPDLAGTRRLRERIERVVSAGFPLWDGSSIALTALVLSAQAIVAEDDARLDAALVNRPRRRVVTLGLFRLNLDQEALAFALRSGPDGLFPEPLVVADSLCESFRRFVPPLML